VWKKEQLLLRSILTGLFACILSAGLPAIASAAQTGDTGIAAPTAGADLAMWNAGPAAVEAARASASESSPRVARMLHIQRFASGIAARGAAMASALTRHAMRFLGVPYSFGGTTANGFDCSGYVQHVFALIGKHLPRTADAQFDVAHRIHGTPKAGDLVFFQTYAPGASHVGISLGGDRFVHASSSHGVTVSSLHDRYWAARYLGAKRIIE
jgi:cell wall-associated NlpC family hydrolase